MTEHLLRRPPMPLLVGCGLYALIEIALAIWAPSGSGWVRIAITLVLFYFLLRSNRVATMLWAICNLLAAIAAAYYTSIFFQQVPIAAIGFTIFGLLLALNFAYLVFNRKLREFNRGPEPLDAKS
jgi:hypothetical protein